MIDVVNEDYSYILAYQRCYLTWCIREWLND